MMCFRGISQDCRLALTGHIEDADTKEKLSGATIFIRELHKYFITDANGDFRLNGLCAGTYNMQVSHAGCETIYRTVKLVKNQHLDVLMPHLRYNLEEVVVSGRKNTVSGYHQQLEKIHLEASRTSSIAEALSKINGVNLLQTGSTISKPVIHGLHSMRVLTINNGVRQEGQQWGNEHAPEIDTYIADKVSVIKGADALMYGSDAIGGVVLIDAKPIRSVPGYNLELNSGYSTNNRLYAASAIFEHQPKKFSAFSYRLQGTIKRSGNVNTPSYTLNNTGTKEENFSLAANWKKEHYQVQAYYSQFQTTIGIFPGSHIGNLTDLVNVINQNRPNDVFLGKQSYDIGRPRQEVLHRLLKLKTSFQKNQHRFNLLFGGQYNHRQEYNIVRSSTNMRPQVSLAVITTSEEINYEHPSFHNLKGTIGISMMQQDNSYSGRYLVPNYRSNNFGMYWVEKWNHNNWNIDAGLRFDDKHVSTKRMKFNGTRVDHEFDFSTFGSSFSAGYKFSDEIKVMAGAALTSRAPHVNELLVDGVHEGSGTYELGDATLRQENAFDISASVSFSNKRKNISGEVYLYRNTIDDFIYQQPLPDEPVLTIVGAFPLIKYQQTDALLQGMDASIKWNIIHPLQFHSRLSVLRARNKAVDDWLIFMPADRWRNELMYQFKDGNKLRGSYISAEAVNVFKPRVPSDANGKQDYKKAPDEYMLVNMSASSTTTIFSVPVTITIGVRNLFDTTYRDYLNSFRYYSDEMGRNITFMLKIPFEKINR